MTPTPSVTPLPNPSPGHSRPRASARLTFSPRILVLGMGSIGQRHLRVLAAIGVRDIVVHTRRPDAVRHLTDATIETDIDAALDREPHLVMICTTADRKVPPATAAARRGCHLFIEKPLSDRLEGVADLQRIVADNHTIVASGFDMRFDPGLIQVKSWIEQGRIGRVLSIQAQVGQYLPDWRPGRDYRDTASARAALGGGAILELTHELDYVSWLLGPVESVCCLTGRVSHLRIDVEDVAAIALQFACGAIGSVHLDFLQRVATRTCRIIGEGGTIEWDHHAQRALLRMVGATEEFLYPAFSRSDRFESQARHLLACLAGDETPRADLAAAIQNLLVALAAKQSAASGRVIRPTCLAM
jgi:predicted dehydrogenase